MTKIDVKKYPILGTANWLNGVPKKEIPKILDIFYEMGAREIDIAPNYPINNNKDYFEGAILSLKDWIDNNNISDLDIILKLGSINNLGTKENNLSHKFLKQQLEKYNQLLRSNISTISIHWDARQTKKDNYDEVYDSLRFLEKCYNNGLQIGFSGVECLEIYASYFRLKPIELSIQAKANIFEKDNIPFIKKSFPDSKVIAYGIFFGARRRKSNGNIKDVLSKLEYQKCMNLIAACSRAVEVNNIYELCLLYAIFEKSISNFIISPSSEEQMRMNFDSYIKFTSILDRMALIKNFETV